MLISSKMSGEADTVTPYKENLNVLHTWISSTNSYPVQKQIISEIGHNIMLEEPDMVNKLSLNFIKSLSR